LLKLLISFCCLGFLSLSTSAFEIYATGSGVEDCKFVPSQQKFTADLQQLLIDQGTNVTVVNGGTRQEKNLEFIWRNFKLDMNSNVKLVIYVSPGGGYKHPQWMQLEYIEKVLAYTQNNGIATIIVLPIRKLDPNDDFLKKTDALTNKYSGYDYGSYAKNISEDPENWVYRYTALMNDTFAPSRQRPKNKEFLTARGCYIWAENMLPLVLRVIKERNIQ
jgi:hypothetical protein